MPVEPIAVVFPGQGSQRPGMGRDFFERYSVARDAFAEANDALGLDLGAICFDEDPRLDRTEFTQPAILVTEIAMLRVLREEAGLAPACFGGHSLGEYTALCAAGVMPLDVAVRLVRQRGALMQAAVPEGEGAMIAVMAPGIAARDLAADFEGIDVDVANRNSPDQIVLSGHKNAIERAIARVPERLAGIEHEVARLNVSAPFHSRAMHAIDAELRLGLTDASSQLVPERASVVTSNLTGAFHGTTLAPLIDALVGQAGGTVDWIANMQALSGVATTIYEVGPHRPLRGFFRAIGRDVVSITLGQEHREGTLRMTIRFERSQWALILGGSSGFGLATAEKLAKHGMSVAIVHRDRRGSMPAIEAAFERIRALGTGFVSFNLDALSPEGQRTALDGLKAELGERDRVRVLVHSIAFGNLKPLARAQGTGHEARARVRLAERLGIPADVLASAIRDALTDGDDADPLAALTDPAEGSEDVLEDEDFDRTVRAMGTSLATWAQALHTQGLFAADARVLGLTSEGNEVAWRGYAAVSAAKAALESVSRAIAVELAPYGIRSNILQPGVTDTPALRLIPGSARMKASARLRNPLGRLTTPADVADVICLLCTDEARWVNGALLRVDGGEHVAGGP